MQFVYSNEKKDGQYPIVSTMILAFSKEEIVFKKSVGVNKLIV